jgi:phospholipid/cholesterol/gamma-HCH transport system substrate-binding protein
MQIGNVLKRPRKPIESYNKVWLGTVGIVVLVALLGAVVLVGKLNIGKSRYEAEFAQAAQLVDGNQVTIAGIQVGSVQGLRLAGDRVVVSFTVDSGVRLGRDTRAAIKLTTILGSRYLELTPAGDGEIPDRTLGLKNTDVPYDLQKTLAGATSTLGPVDAERIAQSVTVMSSTLHGLPDALPEALKNLESLADVIAARRDQIGSLLTNAETVTALLREQRAHLGVLVLQGNQILGEITKRRAAMERLFASVTQLVAHAKTILEDEPQLDEMITNLHEFAKMMADHDALVRSILQTAPITVRNLANATGSGNSLDLNVPAGILVDSWMCAISGRATKFNLVEYFKDCQ